MPESSFLEIPVDVMLGINWNLTYVKNTHGFLKYKSKITLILDSM